MTQPMIRLQRDGDRADLHQAFVVLQEVERALHDSRRPGAAIATAYLDWMQRQVATHNGAVFVAETDGAFQGFVACWVAKNDHIIETPDSNVFGYIADICVLPAWRGRGIAAPLLAAAEAHLAQEGVTRLRIGALAMNDAALSAYRKHGFAPYEVVLEKRVARSDATND
jgi:ribosomal protein S18 acetylase RimI-like enzyme